MYNFGDTRPMLSQTKVFPMLSFQIPHNVGQVEMCTVNVLGILEICFCKQSTGKIGRCTFPVLTPAIEAKQTHFQLFSFLNASSVKKHLEEDVTIV